jgi:cytoskeletal protein RodZ
MSELHIRLGEALKLERQGKNLVLADLAAQLRTSESNLERIEAGDVTAFASPVYFSLYAKSYAESLGVDYGRTMDAIREDIGETTESVVPGTASAPETAPSVAAEATKEPARREKSNRMFIGIVAVTILTSAILATWWLIQSGSKRVTIPASVERSSTPSSPSLFDSNSAPAISDSVALTLSLIARGSSWVSLMADGDTALFRTFSQGETLAVSAQRQMILTISSPAQIDLQLNGLPAKLADRSGRISNVVVTPTNFRAFTGGPPPETAPGPTIVDSSGIPAQPAPKDTQRATGTGR